MRYILVDQQRKENAKAYIDSLGNGEWCVEIKPYRRKRTQAQNNTLWMWCRVIGNELGIGEKELHEQLKIKILGVEKKQVLGQTLILPKSSADLTPREMADFLDAVDQFAKELDINLPYPDDLKFIMDKD